MPLYYEVEGKVLKIRVWRTREHCEAEDDYHLIYDYDDFEILDYNGVEYRKDIKCKDVNDEYCIGYSCGGFIIVYPLRKGGYIKIKRWFDEFDVILEKYTWDGEKWIREVDDPKQKRSHIEILE